MEVNTEQDAENSDSRGKLAKLWIEESQTVLLEEGENTNCQRGEEKNPRKLWRGTFQTEALDSLKYPETTMSESSEEEQRPVMKEEELKEAKDRLGMGGEVKSKTFEVMEECERMGKVAPSVFSGLRSGGETALKKPPARVLRK
ncbi:hypothetical protein GJAV_G00190800 [Gymnothorax javanicus]|nr:hypothetical protein GJAV_G00190800 [Gymnothorax javanicus]